ncbi:ABZJ_00895 family protein [Onishia niordana]|uniref:ABZJ_00895 family protein n=1 Tax=Onishia niordana TaxID=2508711 RepID=UPI00109FF433|nr:ABZJ_00895 family protein [Halomonas niordiana]
MEQDVKINKYVIKFCFAYALGLIAVSLMLYLLDIDANSGVSVAVLIGGAVYAAGKFVENNKRIPSKQEKSKLVWLSLFSCWGLSIASSVIIVLAIAGFDGLLYIYAIVKSMNFLVIPGLFLFVSLLYFLILSWCYGGFAKRQLKNLQKKGKV